jgi:G3E family GTPase
MREDRRIPVTILTGFLGSGKTTLLNRILKEHHGRRIAVIENEFGEAGIDSDLLVQSEEQIVEMNNGCICCTVRDDLVRILKTLLMRADEFERIVIETTGLADPGPVIQTFIAEPTIQLAYRLDSVVTLVDAVHAPIQLEAQHEAREQIAFADRIFITKGDIAGPAQVEAVKSLIRDINPRTPVEEAHFGNVPIDHVLDLHGFDLDAILEMEPGFLEEEDHHHHSDIASFVLRERYPLNPEKLEIWLSVLGSNFGRDLLRYKGVLNISGNPKRVVFQGVHMLMGATDGAPWEDDEPRDSVLVFIGRRLPRDIFEEGFRKCLA